MKSFFTNQRHVLFPPQLFEEMPKLDLKRFYFCMSIPNYQESQLWSKEDEEGYFSINDICLNTIAGIVLSNFIASLFPNLLLSYALNYEL